MSQPYLAEIRIFAGNFAPRGWATCDGQLLSISQNTALFSLLGTTYGGDGRSTFGLPDLRGRAPMQPGSGAGLSPHVLGEAGGTATVTLLSNQLPAHTHAAGAAASSGQPSPEGNVWGTAGRGRPAPYAAPSTLAPMNVATLLPAGGSGAHNNLQPFTGLLFIIALQGIFPQRP